MGGVWATIVLEISRPQLVATDVRAVVAGLVNLETVPGDISVVLSIWQVGSFT